MRKKDPLSPLLDALRNLTRWLQTGEVQGVIIGGVAASILGRPRMTRDIDALILLEEKYWDNFLSEGAQFDFARITGERIPLKRGLKLHMQGHYG